MSRIDNARTAREARLGASGNTAWIGAMHRFLKSEAYQETMREQATEPTSIKSAMRPTVASVMTRAPITVRPATPYKDIVDLLCTHQISAVPVLDALGRPVGVVSEADLIAKHTQSQAKQPRLATRTSRQRWRKAHGQVAMDLMTSPVTTIAADSSLPEAAEIFAHTGLRRLFVVSEGALIGVLARRDLLRVFDRSDRDTCAEVEEHLAGRALLTGTDELYVDVTDGVATVIGSVTRRTHAQRIGELIAEVRGVVMVRNRLCYQIDDVGGHGSAEAV